MKGTITILALALGLTGCATAPPAEPDPAAAARTKERIPDGAGYLDEGPTVALEGAAEGRRKTTLQLLEDRDREIAELRERMNDLERSVELAVAREKAATHEAAESTGEFHRLRDMLEVSLTEQKDLTESLLAARIARLRAEQEMIRLKLAELARDAE